MAIFSGDIFAEQYVISSSVTEVTIGSVSGSTAFGDTQDDTHQFTGSVNVTGSLLVTNSFEAIQSNNYIKLTPSDGVVMSGNNQGAYIKLGGSNTLNLSGYSKVRIGTGNVGLATERVGVTNTAIEFPTANYKISGSSTSTGSFGRVQVASRLILPSVNNNAAPTLAFGDENTGFYEASDNSLSIAIAGARRWFFASDTILISGLIKTNG